MQKATLFVILLSGCTNEPIDLQSSCSCQSEIEQALEAATVQDSDLQCQIDDGAYNAAELRWELDVLKRRVGELEAGR